MNDELRLIDVCSSYFARLGSAISHSDEVVDFFTNLAKGYSPAYGSDILVAMDNEYFYNHSGLKKVSALVQHLYDNTADVAKQDFYKTLISKTVPILHMRFLAKWERLLETISVEFDFINPYEMKINEKTTDEMDSTKNDETSTSKGNSGQHSETRDHTDNSERNGTINITENETFEDSKDGTSNHQVYGYNSNEGVDDSSEKYADNDNSTRQNTTGNTNSDTLDRTEKHTIESIDTQKETGSRTNTETYHRSNPTTRELTRTGNIGNTTRQELVAQQREMLQWQLWNVIFDDIDTVLTRGMF